MAQSNSSIMQIKRALTGASVAALALAAMPALAQTAAPAAPAAGAAPAAAPAAADAAPQVYWVKICGKTQIPDPAAKPDPNSKEPPKLVEKGFCLTQQERLDGNSGAILVSAAVREDDGSDKKGLLLTVPASVIIPAGVHVYFDEEKDEKKVLAIPFEVCLPSGCTAEAEATPAIIDQMNKAKTMTVIGVNIQGIPVPLKLNMGGFTTAMAGKPIEAAKYFNARKNMIMEIQERLYAKQRAAQAAIQGAKEDQAAAAGKPAADGTPPDPTAKPAQ